jgi:hypothetical protein
MATKTKTDAELAAEAYEEAVKASATSGTQEKLTERMIFREQGFVNVDTSNGDPMEWLNNEGIKERIWALTSSDAVVTTDDGREDLPIQRKRLASQVLDKHPAYGTDEWYAQDELWRAGWLKSEQQVWKFVEDKHAATLQRWTRERLGNGHVFVKTTDTVFITAVTKFIKQEILLKEQDKLEKLARTIGEQYALFGQQHPALQSSAVSSIKAVTTRAGKKALAAYTLKAKNGGGNDGAGGDE